MVHGTHTFQFETTRVPAAVSATVSISTSRRRVDSIPERQTGSLLESSKRASLPLPGIINNNQKCVDDWTCAGSRSGNTTRKRNSKINYCESHFCSFCSQDFDTKEELEVHEKKCNNKSALNNTAVASTAPVTIVVEEDGTAPGESRDKFQVKQFVQQQKEQCKGQVENIEPNTNNSGADIVSLLDWLKLESARKCPDGSVNVILLDPDPTSAAQSKPIKTSTGSPVTCKLCLTKLETEPDVKNHVANCWLHNKDRHTFCITCEKPFTHPIKLKQHYKIKHCVTDAQVENKITGQANTNEDALNKNQLDLDLDLLPLGEWIQNRKKMFPDIILVDPDPTSEPYKNSVQPVKQTTHWSACAPLPLMCKLCRFKCESEKLMKCHVQICWTYNKKNHVYCVSCESEFNSVPSLESHQNISHNKSGNKSGNNKSGNKSGNNKSGNKSGNNKSENVAIIRCRDCHQELSTLQDLEEHQDSAQEFFQKMKQIQSMQNMKDCLLALMSSRSLVFTSVVANISPVSVKPNNFNSNKLKITSISTPKPKGGCGRRHMQFSHSEEDEDRQAKGKMQQPDDTNFKCAEKGCKRNYNHKHVHFSQPKDLESLKLVSASVDGSKSSATSFKTSRQTSLTSQHRERGGNEIASIGTESQSVIFGSDSPSPRKRLKATVGCYSELGTRVTRAMLANAKSKD